MVVGEPAEVPLCLADLAETETEEEQGAGRKEGGSSQVIDSEPLEKEMFSEDELKASQRRKNSAG